MRRQVPTPPPRPTARRPETEITVRLKTVTPILGGSYRTREVDEVDIIRVPTVRGHLRFWWRALYGHNFTSARELYEAEKKLWGGATDTEGEDHARSKVEVRVHIANNGKINHSERLQERAEALYGMWPAREETSHGKIIQPAAPRRLPGVRFVLTVGCPSKDLPAVTSTVRAWILFGGYGGRTRRGLGSLALDGQGDVALPQDATRDAFTGVFGTDIFSGASVLRNTPLLRGSSLHTLGAVDDANDAWLTALDWLRVFRQGVGPPDKPRHPPFAPDWDRPSVTDWPEPDKARRLWSGCTDHPPRPGHTATPAWPRAGFGLPMHTKWQRQRRGGGAQYDEPGDFDLLWLPKGEEKPCDRLASPLILKALPLANGMYAPCALWLDRGYPDGQVVLKGKNIAPGSAADFDLLHDPSDTPCFAPLADPAANAADRGKRLRTAFLKWLKRCYSTTEVAP